MTAPMPETMSPREKVAEIVEAAILRHFPSAVVSDTLDDASEILAALASSGDHAELARWIDDYERDAAIDAAEDGDLSHVDDGLREFPMRRVKALIAEVEALRSELDQARSLHHRATDRSRHWEIAAIRADNQSTEAERKLAEAEGLLVELADAPQPKDTGTRFFRAMSSINSYVARMNARTFLSKEAERG